MATHQRSHVLETRIVNQPEFPQVPKTADEIRTEIYARMSAAQKWNEVCRLRELAWKLKAAAIRAKHPELSDLEVASEVRKIFLYAVT